MTTISEIVLASIFATLAATGNPAQKDSHSLVDEHGRNVSKKRLTKAIKRSTIVYVGEEHGQEHHHKFQARVLKIMAKQGPSLLGVEYFSPKQQPILDDFVAGKIALEDFPEAINWKKFWGHNWKAYKPLFKLCQDKKIRIIGLNAPKSLVRKVSRTGLKALDHQTLLQLPRMDLASKAHRERVINDLKKVHPMSDKQLARYYEIFTLWDESMAAGVANAFLNDRRAGLKMLVVAGKAHITTGTGIPARTNRRFKHKSLIVICNSRVQKGQWSFDPKRARLY